MQLPARLRLDRRPPRRFLAAGALALGVLLVLGGLGLSAALTPAAPPATAGGPTFTAAGTWNLLELQHHIAAGEVASITATGEPGAEDAELVAKTQDGQLIVIQSGVTAGEAARSLAGLGFGDLLTAEAWAASRAVRASAPSDPVRSIASTLVPILLLFALVASVLFVLRGRSPLRRSRPAFSVVMPQRGRGGGEPAPQRVPAVRLADVAGCDEAKVELTEAIEFLREPDRFVALGAKIPRGVLLYGPPGTGKTMLARAVANEAGVAFLHVSGSEFVEKYVGVGARRVRDLFAQARKLGRAVIFFDEFDALAKARGGTNTHEEREQTLNQLLVELDGFSTEDDVVVIAATNRLDVLDPAVLRPGRFNRKIHVGLPDVRGRREILGVHARNKPLAAEVDLEALARKTYGFSGAQLADLLNEGAILAARRGGRTLEPTDLQAGWLKVAIGTGRRRSMDGRERAIIAAHEVGHAICGRVHGDRRRVEEISLFAHGEALGVTVSSQEDNDLPSESDLRARLVALMGGRAAEELLFQDVTGGASNDFEKATQIATTMVTRFGMGRDPDATETGASGRGVLSFLVARPGGNLPSEVQPAATRAIRAILDSAYAQACETLVEHLETLRRIAAYLVEEERIDGETFAALFDGTMDAPAAPEEWRPDNARPRAWGEILPFRDRRFRREATRERAAAVGDSGASAPPSIPVAAPLPSAAAAAASGSLASSISTESLGSEAIAGTLVPAAEASDPHPSSAVATPAADELPLAAAPAPVEPTTARGRGDGRAARRGVRGGRTIGLRRLASAWLLAAEARVRVAGGDGRG